MADHLDSPGLKSPNMDARVDITDVYAFAAQEEEEEEEFSRSALVLNVNPLTLASAFDPDAIYEILVDTNADATPDITFKTQFSAVGSDGSQRATVVRAVGADANSRDFSGKVIIKNARVSFGREEKVTERKDSKFFAGVRSDPFFFDLLGFLAGFKFTGSDFFADKNVFGIVLEVPNSALGTNPNIGVWSRVLIPAKDLETPGNGGLVQIDRMGRPAINTVFNHGDDKKTFNAIEPTGDRTTVTTTGKTFLANFEDVLQSFGYDAGGAASIAQILLPDILTFNFNNNAGFLNGRKLTDDVIDIELNLVTKGAVTTDGVGPHTDLLDEFPFLGRPHGAGEKDEQD
ncbi:MAG: DUF4331 domain-containing protein [Thaumarchaeota archaeon]|nr:MAG: DUF4331 domain-containing protein [Nitrososphaerota archaeon]